MAKTAGAGQRRAAARPSGLARGQTTAFPPEARRPRSLVHNFDGNSTATRAVGWPSKDDPDALRSQALSGVRIDDANNNGGYQAAVTNSAARPKFPHKRKGRGLRRKSRLSFIAVSGELLRRRWILFFRGGL